MNRALVLGATGHIGAHVVRALLQRGYEVRAAYRDPRFLFVLERLPVDQIAVDLSDPATLRRAATGCEYVFHCGAYYPRWTEPRTRAIEQGIAHIRRVFDVLQATNAQRIVYTSSAATIASREDRASTEADQEPWPPAHWRPLYATVKIAMEHEVERYAHGGLPVTIVNPTVCVGEYDAHRFSGRLVLLFARGRCPFYTLHHVNAVYTGDVGLGHVLAAERGRVGERYLLGAKDMTVREFAKLVAREAGIAPPRWRLPHVAAMSAALVSECIGAVSRTEPLLPIRAVREKEDHWPRLDGSKAQRELGLSYTPLDEAIRRALRWFRAQGDL